MKKFIKKWKDWWSSLGDPFGIFLGAIIFLPLVLPGPIVIIKGIVEEDPEGIGWGIACCLASASIPFWFHLMAVGENRERAQGEEQQVRRTENLQKKQESIKNALDTVDELIAARPDNVGAPRYQTDADRGFSESFWRVEDFIKNPNDYWISGRKGPRREKDISEW